MFSNQYFDDREDKIIIFGDIVTPKEDNLFLYIIIYGVTIIFIKFPTAIYLVTRPYMVSRTYT